ncbi:YkqB [Clostridium sartagoforme AAU1]|uniref:YkqB n=1 Tax=Clostridium sartagoforme AAU1 TaxID=1202534 RepID=R9C033_9CLOT|nr:hypothetical protein [Clostridium sartagoforme]EOR20576.1 YkqB [Clostridium sartagoforme AAU1]
MAIATGQISIIDYNDALTLTGFIGSNHPKTQMYNPDNSSYTPNWAGANLVLTPSLYKLGTTTDIITSTEVTSVKWFEAGSSTAITTAGNYALSGTKSHILTVKANVLAGLPGKDWICEVTYKDPTTNLDLVHKMSISFSRVVNGGGIADAIAWSPDGNVFKNSSVTSLKAQCDLWRGSVIDNTNVTYQWYQQDSSVSTDQGGGIGWRKLTETANVTTGVTTNTLTVFSGAVSSFATFKCIIKDTDSASNTYNQTFVDTISFIDNSDPIQVSVTSTGGDVFKNGVGSTTLTAKLFQAGNEIDSSGTKYTYKWFKYDKNGNLVSNFGGTGVNYKTGKTLAVGDADVDVKATFSVEVE